MTVPAFFIKIGSSDFLNRQKSLFDSLDSVEKEQNSSSNVQRLEEDEEGESYKRQKKITKHFKNQESLFNKPIELPPRFKRRNRVPDFQRNPHKWTKYSLGDVTQHDMSNESNTAAALAFLNDVKLRKLKANVKVKVEDCEYEANSDRHFHEFNKSVKLEDKDEKDSIVQYQPSTNSYFRNSKYIMAEYVVGEKRKKSKSPRNQVNVEKGKEIFLNHIHEYEDE